MLFEGAAAWLPECTGELGDERFNGGTLPIQENLACSGCSCSGEESLTCSLSYITYTDSSCKNADSAGTVTKACQAFFPTSYVKFGGLELGGTCLANGGTELTRTDPRWEQSVRGCGLSDPRSAGCEDGSICMPEPSSPFEDSACIYQGGEHACPGDYPNKHSYFSSLKDERQCEPCLCAVTDCAGTLIAYDNQSCSIGGANTSEDVSLAVPDTCQALDTSIPVTALRLSIIAPSCSRVLPPSPMGGSIRAEGPFTVCCK